MKESPNKLIPVIRHKMNSSIKLEHRAQSQQMEKFRQIMKNSFRIKKQMRAMCVNVKELRVEGTLTKPRTKDNFIIKYNKSAIKNQTMKNKNDQNEEDSETKASTVVTKYKISQKLIEDQIIKKSRKTITHNRYDTFDRRINHSQSKSKQTSINKVMERLVKEQDPKRPIIYSGQGALKSIKAQHYLMIETQQSKPIVSHRAKARIEVASLTKIMTFYTVYTIAKQKSIDISQENIKITEDVADISGTSANLIQEHIYTIQQLLYGLMLPSGNDAALALAKWAGTILLQETQNKNYIKQFMIRMNQECAKLQMNDSAFGNPHGLPHRDSKTTCEDMGKLCAICLKIPIFREIVGTKIYKYKVMCDRTKKKHIFHWQNTNKLLRRPGFIGIKTGITVTAGPCLASAYHFRDKTYIVIVAKSAKMSRRFKDTRKLISYCLGKIFQGQLTEQEKHILKKLNRTAEDIDSDYSEEEQQFDFGSNHSKQFRKRVRIITEY